MPEMMSHLFASIERSERFIFEQRKLNRVFLLFAIGMGAHAYFQSKKIKALSLKVHELQAEKEE